MFFLSFTRVSRMILTCLTWVSLAIIRTMKTNCTHIFSSTAYIHITLPFSNKKNFKQNKNKSKIIILRKTRSWMTFGKLNEYCGRKCLHVRSSRHSWMKRCVKKEKLYFWCLDLDRKIEFDLAAFQNFCRTSIICLK